MTKKINKENKNNQTPPKNTNNKKKNNNQKNNKYNLNNQDSKNKKKKNKTNNSKQQNNKNIKKQTKNTINKTIQKSSVKEKELVKSNAQENIKKDDLKKQIKNIVEVKKEELKQEKKIIKIDASNNNKNKKRNKRRKKRIFLILILLLILSLNVIKYIEINNNKKLEEMNNKLKEELKQDIILHYNNYVITNKESKLYKLNNNKYEVVGLIANKQELTLDNIEITHETKYFKINISSDEYYIYYKDVDKVEKLTEITNRYKNYIVFNKNIITKDITSFYDEKDNLIYKIPSSYNLPIIIDEKTKYGIEFNNRLLYVKSEDVEKVENNQNTNKKNTNGIAVLNYHFFYDETKESERKDCNQIICHPKGLVEKHAKYFKDNNIFTPTMNEFEMYLDKKINLPKSVLVTIDDGWRTAIGEEIFEKNELNATIFLITSWFEDIPFINQYKYIEYHSHGDDLHDPGICPGGQGGAIKCLEKNKLLADLKLSREKLDGTTTFCYPFYEYNKYSIETLKEAGFTMAFRGGFKKAYPGVNKYEIPRYVVYNDTTVADLSSYIN